jgi:hypothetical protein
VSAPNTTILAALLEEVSPLCASITKQKSSQEKSATYQENANHHLRLLLCWLRPLPRLKEF